LSAVRAEPARWHVIRINAHAPKSETDFFVLNFWRASCDVTVTSAQVARAEPQLSHVVAGPLAQGLAAYRTHVLGKRAPAWCAMLTRGEGVSPEHRVFNEGVRMVLLTPPDRVAQLTQQMGTRAEVVGLDALDVRRAVAYVRSQGARTIMVEAGPSTASALYEPPPLVDHLLISRCGAEVSPAAVGGALPTDDRLFGGLTQLTSAPSDEQSGPWRFEHWVRARP
ncbi:MAG: hypothetical protein ABW321_21660, partial [Polyangiales bacterium]